MARPIPEIPEFDLRKKSKKEIEEYKPKESKSIFDITDRICSNTMLSMNHTVPVTALEHERPLPPEPIPPKPPESFKPEEPNIFEKPAFFPAKPIPHSPKISPSSIPNPNPSVTTTKHVESGYPNYGGYLYSIPGFSAFQPVNHSGMPGYHPGLVQQTQPPPPEPPSPDYLPFQQPNLNVQATIDPLLEDDSMDTDALLMVTDDEGTQPPPSQTDFEEHFTPEIISTVPTVSTPEVTKSQPADSQMSITSLAQGSGATVTIPSILPNKEVKKKPERFSLKTSIPISKIDMKCVSNPPDSLFQNSLAKKPFNPAFTKDPPRVEIQSNIVIKSATIEPETKDIAKSSVPSANNSISTLINAAEAINNTETQFRIPDPPKNDPPSEAKSTPALTKPIFNPMNIESSKTNFNKPPDRDTFASDPKNQILFIQNKNNNNNQNPKMLLTLQQQNPQVLLQRTNFDSKNLQAPSRLSNQNKKCKDDLINEGTSSKVVALKRLHQENCDENDFENLITENQIYGNKIVVKEKSQGTQQEQDIKNKKMMTDKGTATDSKNVVLQPNFLYLSNVQFPNMMIVKNNAKVQTVDSTKTKVTANENKVVNDANVVVPTTDISTVNIGNKNTKPTQPSINKEIHVLKSSNNVIQTLTNKTKPDMVASKPDMVITKSDVVKTKPDNVVCSTGKPENKVIGKPENIVISKPDMMITKPDIIITKPDLVFQPNQKVIMNPQIVYQVPISSIVEGDKLNQPSMMNINKKEFPKFISPKKDYIKAFEQTTTNEKLYIACPYQMDSKLQPKIVITNLRPKINKIEEVSSLDIYEKRKRLRRLKYLSNRENNVTKDCKTLESNSPSSVIAQPVKKVDKVEFRSIITAENIKSEIYKEFASTKGKIYEESSGSESDECDEVELKYYQNIIEQYGVSDRRTDSDKGKSEFLANFRLASQETYKEKDLDLQDRMLNHDKVRSAYATIGRLDVLLNIPQGEIAPKQADAGQAYTSMVTEENLITLRKKTRFLSHLKLTQVTQKYKEGYEKAWEVIIKERHRRNGNLKDTSCNTPWPTFYLNTKDQLQIMTEIKQCVNENNNLIKKMLDTVRDKQSNEDSISVLAEKNFSELNRLSKMADRSVKLVSGQNTRKRDLNPGFDSENIQKQCLEDEKPIQNYAKLNIPNISKIISLKSTQECQSVVTTQATSMDEPWSSAAGVTEMLLEALPIVCKVDADCQVEKNIWPGVENIMKCYKDYDAGRRREIADLHRRNTSLRVEGAHITRAASRDSDRARALLAERQNLAVEENNLRLSLQRLRNAIDEVKNYTGQHDFC